MSVISCCSLPEGTETNFQHFQVEKKVFQKCILFLKVYSWLIKTQISLKEEDILSFNVLNRRSKAFVVCICNSEEHLHLIFMNEFNQTKQTMKANCSILNIFIHSSR